MNSDIQEERSKVTFNIDEFTNWYHGGYENVKKKRFIGKCECIFGKSIINLTRLPYRKLLPQRSRT